MSIKQFISRTLIALEVVSSKLLHMNVEDVKQFISHTLIALTMVMVSRLLISGFDSKDFVIGNYLWLPIGAVILSYLLFGFKVFPGVLLGYLIAEMLIEGSVAGMYLDADISQRELLSRTMSSLGPIFAIVIMRAFSLSNFFDDNKINIGHIFFLVLLSAVISTLLKTFFVYKEAVKFLENPVEHIGSYLVGDMIGGIVFIYIGIKVFVLFFDRNRSI
jgi:integral membrane sensor domain MASE1